MNSKLLLLLYFFLDKTNLCHTANTVISRDALKKNPRKPNLRQIRVIFDLKYLWNHIDSVMVSMLAKGAIDREFEHRSDQNKGYNIDIYCFSAKHTALRTKCKDGLAWHQDNVSEWRDMSIRGLLFQ